MASRKSFIPVFDFAHVFILIGRSAGSARALLPRHEYATNEPASSKKSFPMSALLFRQEMATVRRFVGLPITTWACKLGLPSFPTMLPVKVRTSTCSLIGILM
jgi:hypothetical protein